MAGHFSRQVYDDSGMCLSDLDKCGFTANERVLAHEWYIQWWSYNDWRAFRVLTDIHGWFAPLLIMT